MATSPALYFIGPAGPVRDACAAAADLTQEFDDVDSFAAAEELRAGLVVITDRDEGMALKLLRELWDAGTGWTLAIAEAGDPPTLRSLSVGLPAGPEALAQFAGGDVGAHVSLVDLREVLIQIARNRHDVNNPLTAALAETQILLMDAYEDSEVQEALLTVQEQLRRIRDLLASTAHLRLPRS